jgi:hypothetical protein
VNCAAWALAEVAGISADELLNLLADWVDRRGGVTMPEAAVAVMPGLGFRVASYGGVGPSSASGWARWSARWFPGRALILVVDADGRPGGHALIARDGQLLDNNVPDGLPSADHPYAEARVRVVLKFCKGDELPKPADARRWPIVGEPRGVASGCAGRTRKASE